MSIKITNPLRHRCNQGAKTKIVKLDSDTFDLTGISEVMIIDSDNNHNHIVLAYCNKCRWIAYAKSVYIPFDEDGCPIGLNEIAPRESIEAALRTKHHKCPNCPTSLFQSRIAKID